MGVNKEQVVSPDWVPRPDPTRLTTEQLRREIAALKEVVFTRLNCLEDEMARVIKDVDGRPEAIKEAIQHLKDMLGARMNGMDILAGEKFTALAELRMERDERYNHEFQASKEAIERALTAVREANSAQNRASDLATEKSDANFIKQIDQLQNQIQLQARGTSDQITDIKDRLTRIEGITIGRVDSEKSHRDNTGLWTGIIAALIAFGAMAIGAIGLFIAAYHKV